MFAATLQAGWVTGRFCSKELRRGATVGKRYEARRLLGAGASGEVWEAEDLAEGGAVALKKLRSGLRLPELRARFRREAELLSRIQSDRVARLLDLVVDDEYGHVLVLEKVEGESLADFLKSRRLRVEDAIDLGIELCAAVADLHREHIVHRDLKPGNVILRPVEGGGFRAVLVDLGVGRQIAGEASGDEDEITFITRGPMVIGTMAYLAPEQLIDSSAVSAAADLYALGAILYRAVSGWSPFGGLSEMEIAEVKRAEEAPTLITGRSDVRARAFEELLATALRRRSAERFLTAEDLRDALVAVRAKPGAPGGAPAPSLPSAAEIEAESLLDTLPRAEPSAPRVDEPPPQTRRLVRSTLNAPLESNPSRRRGRALATGSLTALALLLGALVGRFAASRAAAAEAGPTVVRVAPAEPPLLLVADPSPPASPDPPVATSPSAAPSVTVRPSRVGRPGPARVVRVDEPAPPEDAPADRAAPPAADEPRPLPR